MKAEHALLLWVFFAALADVHAQDAGHARGRPESAKGPTVVEVAILIVDVDGVDTPGQSFEANVFLAFRWKDPRQAHDRPGFVVKPLGDVWHPRLQVVNQQKVWSTFDPIVEIDGDGWVNYRMRLWGYFSQPLDLSDYPFDTQDFDIQVVAVGHRESTLVFKESPDVPSGIAEELSVPDWYGFDGSLVFEPYRIMAGAPAVPGVGFRFVATRRTGYYWVKVIFPLILIVAMSWVVFWIDPTEAGTQIGVAMTAMLTLIAYRFAMGTALPKLSYLTRLDYFILAATVLVFASMVEVIVTSHLAKTDRVLLARRIDRWARILFPLVFVVFLADALILRVVS